ncbi:DUF2797 domain-containing protein [Alicyclobacillus sp. TC]|uniref:DUF2797 domain-containing protein n=1 Tax=Alicyclobacillus tolerans TaxID=90970 RepID=A0ABT9LWL0_9BACL|nr:MULTISPECIES: DUF2797 domain-containing protein [Alicyclobacillus]MDP9728662.1 hypothetical protein [Alicyclobacillus tengchongensis]QRF23312.1 DUF2797 domain-containing protein [Alicyclobacillus sp. TC]
MKKFLSDRNFYIYKYIMKDGLIVLYHSASGVYYNLKLVPNEPVDYYIKLSESEIHLNKLLGRTIRMKITGEMFCIHCHRKVKKLYNNGYCYPCFVSLAECDLCILKPETCHFHQGTCRDENYALNHCMIPHYVYLSYTDKSKVGLTRAGRELARWMEQGAIAGKLLCSVSTRKVAGEIEHLLTEYVADKTNWRKMINTHFIDEDEFASTYQLLFEKIKILNVDEIEMVNHSRCYRFFYPMDPLYSQSKLPVSPASLKENEEFEDTLISLKAHYLIFKNCVINMRRYQGYMINVSY